MENMFAGFFKHWDRVQEVTLRLIKQIPADKLDFKPTEKNFTIRELVTHIYHVEKVFTETGKKGELVMDDFYKNIPSPHLETLDDIYNYAVEVHNLTNQYFAGMSAEELIKTVKTPWGDMPLFHHVNGAYEHLWHHRGQIYIYLRLLGVENPVFVYDYPEFKINA